MKLVNHLNHLNREYQFYIQKAPVETGQIVWSGFTFGYNRNAYLETSYDWDTYIKKHQALLRGASGLGCPLEIYNSFRSLILERGGHIHCIDRLVESQISYDVSWGK